MSNCFFLSATMIGDNPKHEQGSNTDRILKFPKTSSTSPDIVTFALLETSSPNKTDEFSEKFRMGEGGVIFNPKIYVADFGPLNRFF